MLLDRLNNAAGDPFTGRIAIILAGASFLIPCAWIALSAPRETHWSILLLLFLGSCFGIFLIARGAFTRIADARDLASPVNFGPFGAVFLLGAIPIASALRRLARTFGR